VAQNVPLDAPIEKIMTKNLFTVNVDSNFQEAKSIIVSAKIRHLPVIDANAKLVGLISVRNAERSVISKQDHDGRENR
jgi:CBS domain-containing protein